MDHNILGKIVPALKVNSTRNKHIPMAGDLVEVPADLVKLQKYVYLMADMFFVNGTPLFITLSRNICFTAVNNIANRKL